MELSVDIVLNMHIDSCEFGHKTKGSPSDFSNTLNFFMFMTLSIWIICSPSPFNPISYAKKQHNAYIQVPIRGHFVDDQIVQGCQALVPQLVGIGGRLAVSPLKSGGWKAIRLPIGWNGNLSGSMLNFGSFFFANIYMYLQIWKIQRIRWVMHHCP